MRFTRLIEIEKPTPELTALPVVSLNTFRADRLIYTHDFTLQIKERTARIARVDCRIRLNDVSGAESCPPLSGST